MPDHGAPDRLPMTLTLRSGPTVGRLGLGAMRISGPGAWGPPRDASDSIALLRRAVDKRDTFIDPAASYGPGGREPLIGNARHPYRAQLVIPSKGGFAN